MNIINSLQKWMVLVCVVFGLIGCSGGGGSSGGNSGKVTLSGTVATGLPLANAQITIKGANGVTITTTTDVDGKYPATNVSTLTPPYLLRVSNAAGNGSLYSVATATGTANIHPFTDLIIRNWYQVQGSDIELEFSGSLDPLNLPTVAGIKTIEAVIRAILATSLTSAGVPTDFNLLTSSFDTNLLGFDKVLEETNVVINFAGVVTVNAVDPVTGGTSTLVTTTVTTNLSLVPAADTAPPTDPAGLVAIPASTSAIVLFWNASTDNVGVAGYNIYSVAAIGGALTKIGTTPYPAYSNTGLTSGISYCYQVEAFDKTGNPSAKIGGTNTCATPIADGNPPSVPSGLTATAVSASQINLSWASSTDNIGVVGYDLYRDGIKIDTVNVTSYSDTGLASSTAYSYTVIAKDAALNPSPASTSVSATTQLGIPSAPTGVTATATIGQATISWTAVNGATSYNIYMATVAGVTKINVGALAGGMTHVGVTNPYIHTGLTDGTTYYFVVTAENIAAGESIESAQVSATPTSYSISGTVSGAATSGVTITVTDAMNTALTTVTATNGSYSVASLANGSYTVTPSLTGYIFNPTSRAVTIANGVNQSGKNFVASVAPASTYTLSGTVTGPYVEGVTITLAGGTTGTTTTNASGAYSFANLPAASYTVTPALPGYTYSPAAPSVAVSGNTTQNFAATSAIASYSISGTVSKSTSKTGSIYLRVYYNACSSCGGTMAGTTIAATGGAYTIRGLKAGTYTVNAEIDTLNSGSKNAGNPTGNSTGITISTGNVTGADIVIADVTPPTPVTPTNGLAVNPSSGGAFIFWDTPQDTNGTEIASAYKIYWSTNPDATTGASSVTVPAHNDSAYLQSGLTNGTLYYKISALVGTTESMPSAVIGPVTIGATSGPNTLSGTVTFTGAATGPLYVGAYSSSASVYSTRIANPVSGVSYSVAGIPTGSYFNFAIIDMNNNGIIDAGDISNTNSNAGNITVNGASTGNITLSAAGARASVGTEHGADVTSNWYNLNLQVNDGTKRVTAVTLVSGKDVPVPSDLGKDWEFRTWFGLNATVPTVGASYGFKVTYSDGTTENLSNSVTAVLSLANMATNLVVNIGTPYSNIVPQLTWAAPTVPLASYTYRVNFSGGNANWYYPNDLNLPSTIFSAVYNADGRANPSSLIPGVPYTWDVNVKDALGNNARRVATYTP